MILINTVNCQTLLDFDDFDQHDQLLDFAGPMAMCVELCEILIKSCGPALNYPADCLPATLHSKHSALISCLSSLISCLLSCLQICCTHPYPQVDVLHCPNSPIRHWLFHRSCISALVKFMRHLLVWWHCPHPSPRVSVLCRPNSLIWHQLFRWFCMSALIKSLRHPWCSASPISDFLHLFDLASVVS
jgi:hypothetical protein